LTGGSGNDTLIGGNTQTTPDTNVFYGGNGHDTISFGNGFAEAYGGPGEDTIDADNGLFDDIDGGSGDDTIKAADGVKDIVDCGEFASPFSSASDTDTADIDEGLDVIEDCEITT
jgi:Ca2+-binding RTX toxin-like protein